MAGVQFRRQDNLQKPPGSGVLSFVSSFSVRRGFLVPSTVHFSTHPLGHVRSLSAGLWCRRRATLRTLVFRALMPRSRALIPDKPSRRNLLGATLLR